MLRISKYEICFSKNYIPNRSEDVFVIKKVKNTVPWTYDTSDLTGDEIVETFHKKEFQKTNQKEFGVEKVIKRKGDKLYGKRKGYNRVRLIKKTKYKWVNIFKNQNLQQE